MERIIEYLNWYQLNYINNYTNIIEVIDVWNHLTITETIDSIY